MLNGGSDEKPLTQNGHIGFRRASVHGLPQIAIRLNQPVQANCK